MAKRIYSFGKGKAEGDKNLVQLLGGKAAALADMSRLGIPVPPGFTLTTEVCSEFYVGNQTLPLGLESEIQEAMGRLERTIGRKFGDANDPLLVSVRSGAPVSMPGMMDTILNLGLTRESVTGLAKISGDERFAWDTYRRLIQMFSNVVLDVGHEKFEEILRRFKKERKIRSDFELDAATLRKISDEYHALVRSSAGRDFPEDSWEQLRLSTEAVFRSWNTARAVTYRRIHSIPENLGTAVTIQAMVFGNRGADSGTGVLFTRNPSTGEPGLMGEYLLNAQGEDVVAGIRTPISINGKRTDAQSEPTLEERMPEIYRELERTSKSLETHYTDMQDIEFTIEKGKLWILQTRTGKRTAHAAVRIAVELVHEGIIRNREAVIRIEPKDLDQLLHPIFDPDAKKTVVAKGLPASPGAACGKAVFTAERAEQMGKKGERVLLVRAETSPEDIGGMHAAQGILTSRGGMTSHAAVVARGMGKCCVVGCSDVEVRSDEGFFVSTNGTKVREGEVISLDGSTGEVFLGEVPTIQAGVGDYFGEFMAWADALRILKVRANADTPADCKIARQFGAQGVGLCRTEHMFFEKNRIDVVRQMILAETKEKRAGFIGKILPMQLEDFRGIFREMRGLPVTIRLLDPPLHEFLPRTDAEIAELAQRIGAAAAELKIRIENLHEMNPMLGHRGCRLGITFPEIYEMQVRAIMTAACEIQKELKDDIFPEIMVPLIVDPRELAILRDRIVAVAEQVKSEHRSHLRYLVGTMIELPRAALLAGEIARKADFFSFGTNDLTQTTFGLSRDDSSRFLPEYIEKGIFSADPFSTMDAGGVLELCKIGTERGRQANPVLKVGICGEHGGDPASIAHFHALGFNYVSCSPFRVPLARLAAAQIALRSSEAST
ncbi:MAG TPA: pyruvate, phosphate dikinase [Bdellovibrionota bacterium]|nr:pyruvate, phosphate dikinase [Bdellovibrionota bacterium]